MTGGSSGESVLGCVSGNNSLPGEMRDSKTAQPGRLRERGASMSTLAKLLAKSTSTQCCHLSGFQH